MVHEDNLGDGAAPRQEGFFIFLLEYFRELEELFFHLRDAFFDGVPLFLLLEELAAAVLEPVLLRGFYFQFFLFLEEFFSFVEEFEQFAAYKISSIIFSSIHMDIRIIVTTYALS